MKHLIVVLFFLMNCSIKIVFCQRSDRDPLLNSKTKIMEAITLGNDSLKLELLEALLSKKGDKRINNTWFEYTNEATQQNFNAKKSKTIQEANLGTNQFIALYLISAIYYGDLEFCEQIQIQYMNSTNEVSQTTNLKYKLCRTFKGESFVRYRVVDNKIVTKLYLIYKRWYEAAKAKGLKNVPPPLNGTVFKWDGER